MKYFTREWAGEEPGEKDCKEVIDAYESYISSIADDSPAGIRCLLHDISLHDGMFRSVIFNQNDDTLLTIVRCGDLQRGYCDVSILYKYPVFDTPPGKITFSEIIDHNDTEILYDEIEVLDGAGFEHRILFYPDGECTIRFKDIEVDFVDAESREFESESPIFKII